ncbi:pyridoxamine 5'-phosphate oxidase family protein [Candidatus Saccharibacteria bacterium]|jgi:uncharacterized protein YhbP (UPF0306 family)|nr:pyridoxamine 5'-phosphate oxidase family protein [Candidatus Saccharibacteria bacterium]
MTTNALHQKIHDYLNEVKMMHLATASNDTPWVCNVWFAADKDLTIYWISSTRRRHSKELVKNSSVAASFCLPSQPNESDKGALQMEGTATEVTNPIELAKALKLYVARGFFTAAQVKNFMASLDHPHRFYKISPERIVFFGSSAEEYLLKK